MNNLTLLILFIIGIVLIIDGVISILVQLKERHKVIPSYLFQIGKLIRVIIGIYTGLCGIGFIVPNDLIFLLIGIFLVLDGVISILVQLKEKHRVIPNWMFQARRILRAGIGFYLILLSFNINLIYL